MSICLYPKCDRPAIYDEMRVCKRHKNYITMYQTSFTMPNNLNDPSLPNYCTDTGDIFDSSNCKNVIVGKDSTAKYSSVDDAYKSVKNIHSKSNSNSSTTETK